MATHPPHNTAEEALIELNIKIGEAEERRDEAFLAGILADDLKFRRANGAVVDKAAYLAALREPANTYEYVRCEDVEAHVYENTAVVALKVRAKGARGGMPFEGTFRNIRVFLKQPGGQPDWRCYMWFNERIQVTQATGQQG